jgi:hypothetical protein
MKRWTLTAAAVVALVGALPATAHDHYAQPAAGAGPHNGNGQVLANSQNHPAFVNGESCETNALPPDFGPAWFGLETAHHGPDAGAKPGKDDGCYQTEGRLSPLNPASDRNPAIG